MSKTFTCPHGHRWTPDADDAGLTLDAARDCPFCTANATPPLAPGSAPTLPRHVVTPADQQGIETALRSPDEPLPAAADWPNLPNYECLGTLGAGGMGVVFRARQRVPSRVVAVKTLREGISAHPTGLARFRNEIEAVAQLQHDNIVPIYEVGEAGGRPYFSMELVEGGSLAQRIRAGKLPAREAAQLVLTLAQAMAYAHSRGIIHRDLKPHNVLLSREGRPKITDFGLAKRLEADSGLTVAEDRLGTPAYMAPEQAAGRHHEVGPATDVYALGVILYECLAGAVPIQGHDHWDLLRRVVHDDPRGFSQAGVKVPRDLDAICQKCLRKSPRDRYASAQELAADLERFLAGEPVTIRPLGRVRRAVRWVRRRPWRAALAGLLCLALASACGGLIAYHGFHVEKHRYFVDVGKRWGVFQGITEVPAAWVSRRHWTARLCYRGWWGPVVRVEILNSRGRPTRWHQTPLIVDDLRQQLPSPVRESQYVVLYDGQGRVSEELGLDEQGGVLWRFRYTYDDVAADPLRACRADFLDGAGERVISPTGVAGVAIERNADGCDVRHTFLDVRGGPAGNADGAWGMAFEVDARGRQTRVQQLDATGQPVAGKLQFSSYRLSYDARGLPAELAYFDRDERPCLHLLGMHRQSLAYDEYFNLVRIEQRDREGRLLQEPPTTAALMTFEIDAQGQLVREQYLSAQQKLLYEVRLTYDDQGRRLQVRTLIAAGDDKHLTTDFYDPLENVVQQVTTPVAGSDEQAAPGRHDPSSPASAAAAPPVWKRFEYDDLGRAIVERKYAADGRTLVSVTEKTYDRLQRVVQERVTDPAGQPLSEKTAEYGGFGPTLVVTVAGDERQEASWTYNDRGQQIEERSTTTSGDQTTSARTTFEYDAGGRRTREVVWTGPDLAQIETATLWTYDAAGRETEERRLGENALEVVRRQVRRYTEQGLVLEETAYGPEDVVRDRTTWSYDSAGHPLEQVEYERGGAEVKRKTRWRFDSQGRELEVAYFGGDGQPVRRGGYQRRLQEYGADGRLVLEVQEGLDGSQGYEVVRIERPDSRREIRSYWTADGASARHQDGNRTWERIYDADGLLVQEIYAGYDPAEGFAPRWLIWYRPDGQVDRTAMQDDAGNPSRDNSSGYTNAQYEYDTLGRHLSTRFTGLDERRSEAAEMVVYYAQFERKWLQEYFAADGLPARGDGGWMRNVLEYDAEGLVVREIGTGYDGALGYAALAWLRDPQGRMREEAYFDDDGAAARCFAGYSRFTREFHGRRQVAQTFFGFSGAAGYARLRWELEADGRLTAEQFLNERGEPVARHDGVARIEYQYDAQGQVADVRLFDAAEQELAGPVQLVVLATVPGGAAQRAGLLPGDVLLTYAGQTAASLGELWAAQDAQPSASAQVEVVVQRAAETLPVQLPAGRWDGVWGETRRVLPVKLSPP